MKLIIDRATWLRGTGNGALLDAHGMKCCLGFYGLACVLTPAQLLGNVEPGDVPSDKWPITCVDTEGNQSYWTERAIEINDSKEMSDVTREHLLVEHFAKVGVDVEFR